MCCYNRSDVWFIMQIMFVRMFIGHCLVSVSTLEIRFGLEVFRLFINVLVFFLVGKARSFETRYRRRTRSD